MQARGSGRGAGRWEALEVKPQPLRVLGVELEMLWEKSASCKHCRRSSSPAGCAAGWLVQVEEAGPVEGDERSEE